MSSWEDPELSKKKKKKKKDKKDKDELSDRGDFGGGGGFGMESRKDSDFDLTPRHSTDRFREHSTDRSGEVEEMKIPEAFRKHSHKKMTFQEIMAADRDVVDHLRREFDTCHEHLRRESGAEERLQREVEGMRARFAELRKEERNMIEQVREAKEKLRAHRALHIDIDLDDLAAGRDRSLLAEEMVFFTKRLESDSRILRNALEANGQLSRHNEDLELQVVNLEKERADIGKEAKQEQEAMKEDQKRVAELRNEVETLKRQQQYREQVRREEELREERYREIKHSMDGGPQHSWAKDVVSPGGFHQRDHNHTSQRPVSTLANCAAASSPVSSRRATCRAPFSPSGKSPHSPGSPQWPKGMGTQAPGLAVPV